MVENGSDNGVPCDTNSAVATENINGRANSVIANMRESITALAVRGIELANGAIASGTTTNEPTQGVDERTAAVDRAPDCGNGGANESCADGGGDDGCVGGSGHVGHRVPSICASVAASTESMGVSQGGNPKLSPKKQAEEHVSRKYTKEEFLARHWNMTLDQMKRVKALLRMGVCEEDLEIADRLLKMGRDISNDTPLTKEEQLLGYNIHQRQRMKALQILGLTEESFERSRAALLSSLGPSAFGFDADETAAWPAKAEAEAEWTPGDKLRRKGHPHQHVAGADSGDSHHHHGLLKMTMVGVSQRSLPRVGTASGSARSLLLKGRAADSSGVGGLTGLRVVGRQHTRRVGSFDTGDYLPDVTPARRMARGAGGGMVGVKLAPVETAVPDGVNVSPEVKSPLSSRTDPG